MSPQKPLAHLPPAAIGIKQEIQARCGTATFVPKGHTIKVINSYGSQVVAVWVFALHEAPTEEEIEAGREDLDKAGDQAEEIVDRNDTNDSTEEMQSAQTQGLPAGPVNQAQPAAPDAEERHEASPAVASTDQAANTTQDEHRQQDSSEDTAPKKAWAAYIPSVRGRSKPSTATDDSQTQDSGAEKGPSAPRKTWISYIPSVPAPKKSNTEKGETRNWASYIPSGHGFSSYIPKDALHTISEIHKRDPNKSVAEQLFDFSKTPAGAAGLSIATGSGYASSLFAAYSAYNRTTAAKATQNRPRMEFLSVSHTRASTLHMSPRIGDVFVTNIRAPLFTLVEDTSPGAHDTLMAACDPLLYKDLGAANWEAHGSCAENLVSALHELNKKVGLKGRNAIGSDVSVNCVPDPLNLFTNVPWTGDGELSFGSPKGKRGDYAKFRVERDAIVVMSACPQDITEINNKRPMVAHFVVESPSEADRKIAEQRDKEAQDIIEKARRRTEAEREKVGPTNEKKQTASAHEQGAPPRDRAPTKLERPSPGHHSSGPPHRGTDPPPPPKQPPPKPGRRKPKKLDRRASSASSTPKT